MIITRTPLRVSFVGGGTDLPAFYTENGGAVVSISVNKYSYLSLHEYFEKPASILKYSETETPQAPHEIRHKIIREVFLKYDISGVDFNSTADVPAGTGMGSSSCFTVGLLNLVLAHKNIKVSQEELASLACEIEIDKLKEPIGRQDQYGCALGGLKFIQFHPDHQVSVENITLDGDAMIKLESSLLLFYIGGTRSASKILAKQNESIRSSAGSRHRLTQMRDQAFELREAIKSDPDVLGEYLHQGWLSKRELTEEISNPVIDDAYQSARAAGALGGKLLGAGAAGFLLVYARSPDHPRIIDALRSYPVHQLKIDQDGAVIIYNQ